MSYNYNYCLKKYVDEIGKIDLAGKELEQGKQKITISLIVTRQ